VRDKRRNPDVLISGAGPAGLMMACLLALHKISFRIIDKKTGRGNYSGAMILHARSMEIIHQMGWSVKFLKEGVITRRINFQFNYSKGFSVDVADFGKGWSLFPYIFILEQSKIEELLIAFIIEQGYEVEEGNELVSFSQHDGSVTSVIKKENGMEELVSSQFLIGAGGTYCLVRRQLKIPFYGVTHPELLFVSDCQAEMPASPSEMLFTFTKHQTLGFFPLPENRWRMDGAIPDLAGKGEQVTFRHVEEYLRKDSRLKLGPVDSSWFSVFRSHSRFARTLKHHHCFLIGDSAHVHSPVGAQGMNTGLQDAYNLAWKLAFFLKGYVRMSILETYQDERLPVAQRIIRYTDRFYLWIVDRSFFVKSVRLYIFPMILRISIFMMNKIKWIRKFIFQSISGTGIHYRRSGLSAPYSKQIFEKTPVPGDRLPSIDYFIGSHTYNLQEKVSYTKYKLLVFGVPALSEGFVEVIEKYRHMLEAEIIPIDPGTEEVYKKMVKGDSSCYLVRPDMYIAWKSDSLNHNSLDRYIRQFLIRVHVFAKA
jgi:2-polyprenyl-6-methoxyphenol hydroxylase-like FAD-dependent oxidoreductase